MNNKSPVLIPGTIIPPTPGPRPKETLHNNPMDRFAGMIFLDRDPNRTLEDYFSEYDYWEVYSETKPYSKRIYQAAYKGVMRDYNNYLCVMNTQDGEEHYVLAKRVKNELEDLEPYCPCLTCNASRLNPLKYIWCPICTQCIKAGNGYAKPEYIATAKNLKRAKEEMRKQAPSKYSKFLDKIHWMRVTEIAMVIIFFSIIICYK